MSIAKMCRVLPKLRLNMRRSWARIIFFSSCKITDWKIRITSTRKLSKSGENLTFPSLRPTTAIIWIKKIFVRMRFFSVCKQEKPSLILTECNIRRLNFILSLLKRWWSCSRKHRKPSQIPSRLLSVVNWN